jgi:hypothetical protein
MLWREVRLVIKGTYECLTTSNHSLACRENTILVIIERVMATVVAVVANRIYDFSTTTTTEITRLKGRFHVFSIDSYSSASVCTASGRRWGRAPGSVTSCPTSGRGSKFELRQNATSASILGPFAAGSHDFCSASWCWRQFSHQLIGWKTVNQFSIMVYGAICLIQMRISCLLAELKIFGDQRTVSNVRMQCQ